jgi:hypothetical protein
VLGIAADRAGSEIEIPGAVHPRVAAQILHEASFCDDALMQEYFGGVLAAARTPTGRDDRGAKWAAVVARLSSYEVRLHYLIYREVQRAVADTSIDLGDGNQLARHGIYLSAQGFVSAMELGRDDPEPQVAADHAVTGLIREGFLQPDVWCVELTREWMPESEGTRAGGLVAVPTHSGVELFLWAHGRRSGQATLLTAPSAEFRISHPVPEADATVLPDSSWTAHMPSSST